MTTAYDIEDCLDALLDLHPEMTILQARVLFFVFTRGSCTQFDVENELDLSYDTAKRAIEYWTLNSALERRPSGAFILKELDYTDKRHRHLRLTEYGRNWFSGNERQAA
jgi:hypothetical protein